MKQQLTIAIIGSGSAGPVAASLLARQGHEVSIFERAPVKLPVGAGFMLQPSGMEVLKELGCLEEVLANTDRIDSLFCKTIKGNVLLDLYYKDVAPHLFGAGVQRSTFLDILLTQCKKDKVDLHWGTEVTDISLHQDKRVLHSTDQEVGAFDLVILCDGAKSQLRQHLDIPQKVSVYPWGALWYIGKRTPEFKSNELWQVVGGTKLLNGFLPTGTKENLLSLFYSFKLSNYQTFLTTPLDSWKDSILQSAPQAESFLQQITDHSQLPIAQYHDVVMPHWHTKRAVVLGDAGHALSPQLGQGVNLALQDAHALAKVIEHSPTLPSALAEYSTQRRRQLRFYQFATRTMTPFFQSDYSALGTIRDLCFPMATKSKWITRQMTLSMAGYKNGIFTSKEIEFNH